MQYKLEIQSLTKRFGEKTLFKDLNLTVTGPAILWAPSGWGKTTLLRILMGLEVPTSGTVSGVGRVGAVFQEDRLCPQLNAVQNVELVLPEGKEQYKEQIEMDFLRFGLDRAALALPARKLSGGQKQRLCIARAILRKPKVLILDDSTSAVDTATDAKIRAALKEALPGSTKLIIAQRISSVMDADVILVLDDGKISGMGTHEQLMASNQIYREVYQSQQEGVSIDG